MLRLELIDSILTTIANIVGARKHNTIAMINKDE